MPHNLFNSLQSFSPNSGQTGQFHSLPQLEKEGIGKISRLPVSIRIVLGFHRCALAGRPRGDAIGRRAFE